MYKLFQERIYKRSRYKPWAFSFNSIKWKMDKSIVRVSLKFLAHGLNHGLWKNELPNKNISTVSFGILQLWRWIKNMQNLEYHFVWHLFMQPYFFQNKPLGMTIPWSLILFFLSFYFITPFELNQKAREKQKKMDKSIVHISAHFFTFL